MQAPEKIAPVASQSTSPRRFAWDAEMLLKMDSIGIFGDARIELIEGEVIEMSPIGPRHAMITAKITEILIRSFSIGYVVSPQNPVKLSNRSIPQPDIAVLRGTYRDFFDTLPETAVLMVEVADSTLLSDRSDKASLYARYGIPELWIVNVASEELEIYRQPRPDAPARHGFSYGLRQVTGREDAVSPLELPEVSIAVADLLV